MKFIHLFICRVGTLQIFEQSMRFKLWIPQVLMCKFGTTEEMNYVHLDTGIFESTLWLAPWRMSILVLTQ